MSENVKPESLTQIISENEFLPLAEEMSVNFFQTFNVLKLVHSKKLDIGRKFYSSMVQEAELLESFLDEHGARENQTWSFFTEYVASVRNLVIAAFYINHLIDRYPFYRLRDTQEIKEKFHEEAHETLDFLNQSILNLIAEIKVEAGKIQLAVPDDSIDSSEFAEIEVNKQLPHTATDETVKEDVDRIVDIFEKMRKVAKTMQDLDITPTNDLEEMKKIVPGKIDEKKIRMMQNTIHSIQSEFDTYIKNTPIELKHPHLRGFRGYISMPLHFLEVILWLCHFYERHEDEIRHSECKTKISTLVNKNRLLDRIINFCFLNCLYYVNEGEKLSKEVLSALVKSVRYELPIPKPLGFHARPSTYISLIVREHDAEAWLIVDGEKYSARSVMSLLQAGGAIADRGYQEVIFEGDQRVLDDIKILSKHNYCEEGNIPHELSYLRL